MKKNLIIGSLLIVQSFFFIACDKKSNVAESQQIEKSNPTELNLISGKTNILFVTKENCGSCETLKETMKHSQISAMLEKDFNIVYIDINNADILPAKLDKPYGTPTLYFIDASGTQLIEPMVGAKDESELASILTEAAETYHKQFHNAK